MTPPVLPKPTILVVDDTVENLRVLSVALTKQGYDVRGVVNGAMALRAAHADPPDLILLDIRMPGMDGYEVCRCLKEANQTREIPIIFLSALGDSLDKVQAFAVGGADYVTKPFQLDEVLVRVKNQLDVRVAHNMVQEINHILEQQVQARTAELAIANQTLRQEIEDRKRIEADLRESEARYRLVADNITDLVGLHDLQGRFIYVSPSCDRLLGYAAPDLMEKPLYDLIHGEDRERVHLQIQAGLQHREILQLVYRVQNKAEHELWLETSVRPIVNAQGQVEQFQTASRDVTKRMAIAEQLRRQALYDDLTQLPNRTLFMDRVSYALHQGPSQKAFAVMLIDLDRFQLINDSLGHLAGDQLLTSVAHALSPCLQSGDTLARWGGDEFGILLPNLTDITSVIDTARTLQATLARPIQLGQHPVVISASIGIVWSDNHYQSATEILRDADIAMYRAKNQGRDGYEIFAPEMHQAMLQRLNLEHELRQALEHQQLQVYFQPLVDMATQRICGVEALTRWHHPHQGTISPDVFIPIAEETGLIVAIGEWVLRATCNQLRQWQRQFPEIPLYGSVNVASRQLQQPGFVTMVEQVLATTGLSPLYLQLEITESAFIEDTQRTAQVLTALRQQQVRISLDDFGTGYSSLSYLQRFPVDSLKIDQSFVGKIQPETTSQSEAMGIIRAIVGLAQAMNMAVIPEGLETAHQLHLLRQLGCQVGQGHYFSRPLPAAAITQRLRQGLLFGDDLSAGSGSANV